MAWKRRIVFCSGLMGLLGCLGASSVVYVAEDTAQEGKVSVGFRAGPAIPTQEIVDNTNTGLGHALNFQATYGLNRWINIGSMLTWQRLSVDVESPKSDLAAAPDFTKRHRRLRLRGSGW